MLVSWVDANSYFQTHFLCVQCANVNVCSSEKVDTIMLVFALNPTLWIMDLLSTLTHIGEGIVSCFGVYLIAQCCTCKYTMISSRNAFL